jgi:LuxR family maltose regulon positive regulatory protein
VFIDEGAPMVNLLRQAGVQGIQTGYVSQLLSVAAATAEAITSEASPLVDPLSERELEILRLIALGSSNPEIAEELVVAIGTVKSHTGNIYSKLGVRNRTEAVARARELDLL